MSIQGTRFGSIDDLAKAKVSVTIDQGVLAAADLNARAAGLNRSEMIEQSLRNEHPNLA